MYQEIIAVIADHAGMPAEKVTPLATLAVDLDLDSLDLIELGLAMERRFDILIGDDEVDDPSTGTVAGLVELVQNKMAP